MKMMAIVKDGMGKACSKHGKVCNAHKILVEKPEWKRSLGRPMHRQDDNIRVNLKKTGWEGVDWIHLDQDRDPRWAAANMNINF
jgi:hypothetical protein